MLEITVQWFLVEVWQSVASAVQRPKPSRRPLAVLILSSCKAKLSLFSCTTTPWKTELCTNILRAYTIRRVYSEEMDVIFHGPSCLEWTLGWNTSPRVSHAAQCETAYLITVQPKGQSTEQTHGMIDVITFHLWLVHTRPTHSDLQSSSATFAFVCHTCGCSWRATQMEDWRIMRPAVPSFCTSQLENNDCFRNGGLANAPV